MSKWIDHDGGKCPVSEDEIVQFIMKCEREGDEAVNEPVVAAALLWPWVGDEYDIVRYRINSNNHDI